MVEKTALLVFRFEDDASQPDLQGFVSDFIHSHGSNLLKAVRFINFEDGAAYERVMKIINGA